jgi:hypothetical protein
VNTLLTVARSAEDPASCPTIVKRLTSAVIESGHLCVPTRIRDTQKLADSLPARRHTNIALGCRCLHRRVINSNFTRAI